MKGDFSRRGFDVSHHYSAVLLNQGGLLTDSDWREELDIVRHRVETETLDVVGPCGGPVDAAAFALSPGSQPLALDLSSGSPPQLWIAADDGYVFNTVDSGASWTTVDTGTTAALVAIRFVGAAGWAVGERGTVVRSADSGATWSVSTTGSAMDLRGVAASGSTDAWAVGDGGTVLLTIDSGTTWTQVSAGSGQLNGVAFQSPTRGVVVGDDATILMTSDGGNTWNACACPVVSDLVGVAFVDANNIWACGSGGTILKSADGGTTWVAQTSGTTETLRSVAFSSATTGIATGVSGVLLSTTDGGTTWTSIASGLHSDSLGAVLQGSDVWTVTQGSAAVHRISILTGLTVDLPLPAVGLSIGSGRYYVHGTLCEVDHPVSYYDQPDRRQVPRLTPGQYVVYVQAWQRMLCAIEAPSIREVALGSADPSDRVKTVWQVRTATLPPASPSVYSCATPVDQLDALSWPPAARMRARSEPQIAATSLCDIGATAGYRRLENQLYRVEIQQGGATPSFKWSRENGSVAFGIQSIGLPSAGSPVETVVTLTSRGKDENLELAAGDWVELVNDALALEQRAGQLFQFLRDGADTLDVVLAGAVPASLAVDPALHPLLRRWDHQASPQSSVALVEGTWIDLEDGVQVWFDPNGGYRPGDYWVIPARTATGDVVWPRNGSGEPLPRPPEGVEDRVCRLGLVSVAADGTVTLDSDCRHLFPPLTQLEQLLYVSGDGQEGLPGQVLAQPPTVRVARGTYPVAGAVVRFAIASGNGSIVGSGTGTTLDVVTDADGLAKCQWTLDSNLAASARHQTLSAELLAEDDTVLPGTGVLFAADAAFSMVSVGGDGQAAGAGAVLDQPLEVRISNDQIPFTAAQVVFNVVAGGGAITSANPAPAAATGIAAATWQLGVAGPQRVEAELRDGAGAVVQRIAFNANIAAAGAAGGGCAITVGAGGDIAQLDDATLKALLEKHKGNLCLCFLSGQHVIDKLTAAGQGQFRLAMHGCGQAARVQISQGWSFDKFDRVEISQLSIVAQQGSQLLFTGCTDVVLEDLGILAPDDREIPVLEFKQVERVRILDTRLQMKVQTLSVMFDDGDADTHISNSDIQGIISFYGRPATPKLPLPELPVANLVNVANGSSLQFTPSKGRLRLTSNRLDALAISRDKAAAITNVIPTALAGGAAVVPDVFVDAVIVGNSFDAAASQFVSQRLVLSSNTFMGKPAGNELGVFLAGGAGVVGNVALTVGDSATLYIFTPVGRTKQAGNSVFIIPVGA